MSKKTSVKPPHREASPTEQTRAALVH
ncbi:MAG: DUF1956 domain-containing protein, partial [Mesorhizobium sp.]